MKGPVGLTRALARAIRRRGIHINCIAPGAVETAAEARVATPEQIRAVIAQQCLGRRIVPLDIARVCVFLASEWSDGMTGQTLKMDGGRVLR